MQKQLLMQLRRPYKQCKVDPALDGRERAADLDRRK